MNILINASFKSNDTYPLTDKCPNSLLKVAGKSILSYILENLKDTATAIFIAFDSHEQTIKTIVEKFSPVRNYHFININKKVSINLNNNNLLYIDAQHLYSEHDLKQLINTPDSILSFDKFPPNSTNGVCAYLSQNFTEELFVNNFNNTRTNIVNIANNLQTCSALSSHKLQYAWDLLTANELLMRDIKTDIEAETEPYCTIKGEVIAGKGTVIKNGAYIEGPVIIGENCTIGPNCYVRHNTVLGNNSKVGNAVEIKNTIVGNDVNIYHLSYLGDSVIGDRTNIGAGFITANLRHDGKTIITNINGKKIDTGRNKIGVFLGENVHTGINTSVYPGRKIAADTNTLPGEIISKDK